MGGSDIQTRLFNDAYRVLSDPERRKAYDHQLAGAGEATIPTGTDQPAADRAPYAEPEPEPWGADDEWREDSGSTAPTGAQSREGGDRPTWLTAALAQTPIKVSPSFDQGLKAYRIALAVWGVFAVATMAAAFIHGRDGVVIAPIAVALMLAPILPPLFNRPEAAKAGLCGVVGAVGIVLWGTGSNQPGATAALSWLTALGWIAVVFVARRRGRVTVLNRRLGPTESLEYNQWGTPGASRAGKMERYAARATAQQLEPIFVIPGAKVIHSLGWPGRPDLSIDHGILCGDRLALISSQAWPPGTYTMDNHGFVLRDGWHFPGGETYLPHAVVAWRQRLPHLQVAAFIVVHTTSPGAAVRVHVSTTASMAVVRGEDAAEQLGGWLAPAAGHLDRRMFAQLLG